MTLLSSETQQHLTVGPNDANIRASFPGMAHFASTGPKGATCRECAFWKLPARPTSKSNEQRPCAKYTQLMFGKIGKSVPGGAFACRHFERKAQP
jgi:hypothetical protein